MRVAMVSEHASPLATLGGVDAGGQNVHVAELAAAAARLGADVVVYTRREERDVPRRVRFRPGVVVEHVDAGRPHPIPKDELLPHMDEFGTYLRRAWTAEPPDIAHAHFWMSGLASLHAAVPVGIPTVLTFHALGVVKRRHQGDKDTSPPERLAVENRLLREVDHIVATSTDEVFELARLGLDPGAATVIPCGVDLARFRPDGPVAERRPGVRRIVVVSRLVERKGIGNVIAALPGIADAELLVAGGPEAAHLGDDREAVRLSTLARELGVADRVFLLGRLERDEVPALLRSADVVACAPWYEPFGMVAVEAMACGVPVVASAVGGLVDTVVDGVTGFHVPPRDVGALRDALARVLADEALRRSLGAAGAKRARSRYTWERVAQATLDVYRMVAGEVPSRQAEAATRRRPRWAGRDGRH
ncbi:MAG TPA: glycosyltransferase [Actinomycetota bacterium]|nr:glycosyltransferase [Actinomycetota bacterium]